MTIYHFTLTVEGADLLSADAQDALFEAGCDDATFGQSGHVQTADFDRQAKDFGNAVASAINAIEASVPGARVIDLHRQRDAVASG